VALLRDVDLGNRPPWVNIVLHDIMPVDVVLEWLFYPPRVKLGTTQLLMCQGFLLLYLVCCFAGRTSAGIPTLSLIPQRSAPMAMSPSTIKQQRYRAFRNENSLLMIMNQTCAKNV
ncbi:MAG: hypothetical protein ABIW02_01105, partial [Nitrosospira sp.]